MKAGPVGYGEACQVGLDNACRDGLTCEGSKCLHNEGKECASEQDTGADLQQVCVSGMACINSIDTEVMVC